MGLGTGEIIAIVIILFLLFGATRLPQLAKSLGQSRKAFKDGIREAEEDERREAEEASRRQLDAPPTPQINAMSDEDLAAEMHRRAEAKQI